MNKIIICIPTYNRTEQINSLLSDLEKQDDSDFSLVILNDGANTETKDVLENRNPKFDFHFFESKNPSGLPGARNKILDYIEKNNFADEKTFIAFLDDDLIIKDDFIMKIKKCSNLFAGFTFHMIQKGSANIFNFSDNNFLKFIFRPLIGKIFPIFGLIFGGFYINSKKIRTIDHIMGCCMIYNFSKNRRKRFDENLNEGNYSGEDTEFSYGLKKSGTDLFFVGNYTFVHNTADSGGCRSKDRSTSYYWYWKHKLYIIKKYHGRFILASATSVCLLESIFLSIIFKTNLVNVYLKASKEYA